MKKWLVWTGLLIMLFCVPAMAQDQPTFDGYVILGRADTTSITASITAQNTTELYLVWGPTDGSSQKQSDVFTCDATHPAVIIMDGLSQGQNGEYQLFWKENGDSIFQVSGKKTFQLPRMQGETFNFVIQSDSHLLNKADKVLYQQSMDSMATLMPDLMMDLGDTFLLDQNKNVMSQTDDEVESVYREQLAYFSTVAQSAPLYLTVGNHEGEYGAYIGGLATQSMNARMKYFLNPIPNSFYTGNTQDAAQDYYAFTWGDALFVSIDPYRYTTMSPTEKMNGWDWTLGKVQYDWFSKTLLESKAKYKFVFSHHAIGNIRGGKSIASLFEWGGYDKKGKYLFDEKRPGWGKPIHQLMVDAGVTIFFQGHDHLFAREEVDGIIYQTLPKPAELVADKQNNFDAYPDADVLLNSGFLNVTVSEQNVRVDYIRNYFVSTQTQEGNQGTIYSYTVDGNGVCNVLTDHQDDLSSYPMNSVSTDDETGKAKNVGKNNQQNTDDASDQKVGKQKKQSIAEPAAISNTLIEVPTIGYSFCIQADSHLDERTSTERYRATLQAMAQTNPNFVIDLGDTSMAEKLASTEDEVIARYQLAREYFDLLGNIPLYLVNGNHDGESGIPSPKGDMLTWARNARLTYFPYPGEQVNGNVTSANYYTFTIGNAQIIVLDPFTFTVEKVGNKNDGWSATLGYTQYEWLRNVLESSTSKYKLVFIHNLVGGIGKDQRGGAEASQFFEWGGSSADGTDAFASMRPDWEAPIHDLLLKYNVTIVFHGHDHFYARQERDGIIYQLVPQPGTPGKSIDSAADYGYNEGTFLPSPGFLRVVGTDNGLSVEYVYIGENGPVIADAYSIPRQS